MNMEILAVSMLGAVIITSIICGTIFLCVNEYMATVRAKGWPGQRSE